MQLVEQLRSGTAATKAAAAGRLANMASQSGTERSGIVAADAIGPLVALLHYGNDDGKANSALALGNLAADGAHRGAIFAAGAIGPLEALRQHGDANGKANSAWALGNLGLGV
jgi:membrane-bound lytic murein transglycosylase B